MKFRYIISLLVIVSMFLMVAPAMADEDPPTIVTVSGSFDFFPESYATYIDGGRMLKDAYEEEIWVGDIVGTATAPFRVSVNPDGTMNAWLLAEFEGTILGEYEGTLVMMSLYTRHSKNTHWSGEWIIMSGTGDFENVQGYGTAWGPGFIPDDTEPDIYYLGYLVFPDNE